MIKGFKYRIYPTKEQEVLISKTFGCCRFVYNQLLAKKIESYKTENKSLSKIDCVNYCNRELKKEYKWLKDVDSTSLTNSIFSLDNAYKNFFRRLKQGTEKLGFPKFKSKKSNKFSYKTSFNNNNIKADFESNKIQLPKLKWIKCKLHRKFEGKIIFATVSKNPSGKYFVSFNVEVSNHIPLEPNNNKIGIDLGIKDIVITSNGEIFNNNKIIFKYENKLSKLQRRMDRKQNGSKNRDKQRIKIARLYEKITNIRKHNLHLISSKLIKENQFIFSEDLNVKGMLKNHNLAKSISDVSWHELISQLEYKSQWYGRIYMKIDRFSPTSQTCSVCGYKNSDVKNLNIRSWDCPICNAHHDRDINASINILNEGIKLIA